VASTEGWAGELSKLGFRLLQIAAVVVVEEIARAWLDTAFEDDEIVYEKPRKRIAKTKKKKNRA
jgi:hypothetical protein